MKKLMWQVVSAIRKQLGMGCLKAAVLAVTVGAAGAVCAASYTNSATGNWSAGGSWTGTAPSAGGASDAAVVFRAAGTDNSTNDLTGNFALNRLEFAAGAVTLSGNALSFTNNGATGPQVVNNSGNVVTINNPIIGLGSDTTVSTPNGVTFNGLLSGKGGLIKTGANTLTLSTSNHTYVGSTVVSAGTLLIQTANPATPSIGSTNFVVQSGTTLRITGTANPYWYASANSMFNVQSNASLLIEANAMQCGYLIAQSSATVTGSPLLYGLDTAAQKTATLGSVNLARIILQPSGSTPSTQTIRFDGTGTGLKIGTDASLPLSWRPGGVSGLQTINFDIAHSPAASVDLLVPWLNLRPSATGIAFFKQGAGVMQLNGMDWASGNSNAPVACTVSSGALVLNSSATNVFGVNFTSVTVSNGATLQLGTNSTVGAIYTNVANEGTVAFNRSDAYTFSKVISGGGGVVQKGGGTLTLTGANTYGGETVVSNSTLVVKSPGSLGGSGAVTVTAGSTLGGNGTINGTVALSAGAALAPAGTNAIGTLTLANSGASALTLNGSALLYDLSNVSGTCDLLSVTGTLALNGANTIALSFPNGATPAGTYTLMTYAAKTGSGTLALNAVYPNARLDVGDTNVVLTVTGTGITYLKWKGNVSGTWDTTTLNWLRDGSASAYSAGDAVTFDDSASGNFTIGSTDAVSPTSVTINNSAAGIASNYTVAASIGGASTALSKLGNGLATLSGTNTYSGGTTLGGGTLSIGSYSNLPAAGGLTFNGGTLRLTGTAISSLNPYAINWGTFSGGLNVTNANVTLTVTNSIGGPGSLSKQGAGTLALTSANTYTGGTTAGAGFLNVSNGGGLGSGAVTVADAATLALSGGITCTNALTIMGVGNSYGALQSASDSSNVWSGPVTLGSDGTRLGGFGPTAVLNVRGVIGSGANPFTLIVRSLSTGGTLILSANNTWLGSTWLRCGILRLGVNNALPTSTVLQIGLGASQANNVDAAFDLAGYNQQVAGLFNVSPLDNMRVVTNSAATPSTLTVANPSTSYSYDGVIAGNVSLVKSGNGTLTLANTNTTFGSYTVNSGTLAVNGAGTLGVNCTNVTVNAGTLALSNSVSIADNALLRIANGGGAKVNLAAGVNEAVGTLYFADKQRPGGTYGAAGSGASVIDAEHFSGTGILTVLHGNGGLLFKIQ